MAKAPKKKTQPENGEVCKKPDIRRSKYSDELLEEIAHRLSQGEPLEQICRDDHMPTSTAVRDWMDGKVKTVDANKVTFAIARAREAGEDAIACNARLVARGVEGHSSGDVQRDKLIIDTDLKLLAKWNPKRYGERHIVQGDKDSDPVQIVPVLNVTTSTTS